MASQGENASYKCTEESWLVRKKRQSLVVVVLFFNVADP